MHTNQTFNSLTIDGTSRLPIPENIKEATKDFKWDDLIWNAVGLPNFGASFSLLGDRLYFEGDANNNLNVHEEDFTGQVLINAVINPQGVSEVVYHITFELTFCKGTLLESKLHETHTQSRAEYEDGFQKFLRTSRRYSVFVNSWFGRWIYRPYFYVIKWITIGVSWLVTFILNIFIWFMNLITPFKF